MKKNPWGQTACFPCLDPEFLRLQKVKNCGCKQKKMSYVPKDFVSLCKTVDVRNFTIFLVLKFVSKR